jgi:uncharacterized membrane protein HdeD (DUF308 family)
MTTTPRQQTATLAATLSTLYFVRFAFAIVWAILVAFIATRSTVAAGLLLVAYPVFDVIAAVVDRRASRSTRPGPLLFVNMALSLLTAIGLGFAVASGTSAVLRVWGAWAITAGAVQLVVALLRYRLGGQWPMILSGGISVLAGTGFVVQSSGAAPSLTNLAGYAVLGGVFFLVSALRLQRSSRRAEA